MELKLNETPVRTSRNYNINNIKIKNIEEIIGNLEFNNIEIEGIDINYASSNLSPLKLKYGVGDALIEEIEKNANHKLKLEIESDVNAEIKNIFNEDNIKLIDNIEINVKKDVNANILIKYTKEEDLNYYHNGAIRVNVDDNSKVNIILVNLLNSKSNNFISIENDLKENANLKYVIVDFGGKNSITNYYSKIVRKKSKKYVKYNISWKRGELNRFKLYSRAYRRRNRNRNRSSRSIKR